MLKYKKYIILFLIILVSLACFLYDFKKSDYKFQNDFNEDFSIVFFDVGNADSALIQFSNYAVLIDAADRNSLCSIKNKLEERKIKVLDLVIITHPHSDHYGQMPEIIENFYINKLITCDSELDSNEKSNYKFFLKKLRDKKIKLEFVKSGEKFKIGDIYIQILGPVKKYKEANNNSVITRILYKNFSFLFMGDAEKQAEKDLVKSGQNLKSDLIKVAHHGSSSSTIFDLLSKVTPKIAIISSGNLNPKVIKKLKRSNMKIYNTKSHGDIKISINQDNKNLELKAEQKILNAA
jgi:competence protein ComEC